jgi:hypothetical protein
VIPPPPGVNIGDPDDVWINMQCGESEILDLGQQTWIGTLVFYEHLNIVECEGGICLDWIVISLSYSVNGPWNMVFYWGDDVDANNGSILPYHYATGERNNEIIHPNELHNTFGILIPVNGTYRYVLFDSPTPCPEVAQVDAIDILP